MENYTIGCDVHKHYSQITVMDIHAQICQRNRIELVSCRKKSRTENVQVTTFSSYDRFDGIRQQILYG
jgi:hypothetical protein